MSAQAVRHSILALDIENFGTRSNAVRKSLRRTMHEVFADAREQVALLPGEELAVEDRADGCVVLFPATVSTVLLAGPFLRALHDELAERARLFSAAPAMRFRVALHRGSATRDARGWSGDALDTTCRLVGAPALRVVLAAASKAHLAFIVSDTIYQGVLRHGYHPIDTAAYLPVDFEAEHGIPLRGWLTTPGYPAPPGLLGSRTAEAARGDSASTTDGAHADPGAHTNKTVHDPAPEVAAERTRPRNPDRPSVTFKARIVNGDPVAGSKYVRGQERP